MPQRGDSGTPLAKKLGLRARVIGCGTDNIAPPSLGPVEVKACAVVEVGAGPKLVIRKERRERR